jgi:hypothetical protein
MTTQSKKTRKTRGAKKAPTFLQQLKELDKDQQDLWLGVGVLRSILVDTGAGADLASIPRAVWEDIMWAAREIDEATGGSLTEHLDDARHVEILTAAADEAAA